MSDWIWTAKEASFPVKVAAGGQLASNEWWTHRDAVQNMRENPTLVDKNGAFYTGTNNFSHPAFDKPIAASTRE